MYIAFNAPHDPRQSPREFVDMYPADDISVPESFDSEYPYKDQIGCSADLRDEKLAPFPRTPFAVQTHLAEYYAIISHLDLQVGRIIDALKSSGLAGNTYIIYSADHGLSCGAHGFMGKQNMYDHSLKPPLIITGPGIGSKISSDALVYLQDIVPTTLELANIPIPDYLEFKSLGSLIHGDGRQSNYPNIYGCYRDLQRMIRDDRYKLIAYPRAGILRLYDLQNDPEELNDLAGSEDYKERIGVMFTELEKTCESVGDTLKIRELYRMD